MPNTSTPSGFDARRGVTPHKPLIPVEVGDGLRLAEYMEFGLPFAHPHIHSVGTVAAPSTVPALPTAGADQVNPMIIPGALGCNYMEMYQTTAQTLMPSLHATKGLEIALDQVNNESVEYVFGGNSASNPLGYTAGVDQGVFLEATFEITDVSGMDQFGIFWRKQEAYAVPASFLTTGDPTYTDIVLFGFATAVADPNPLKVSYDLNDSGSCTILDPNFTVPDAGFVRLMTQINRRKTSFWINGMPLGSTISKDGVGTAITAQNTKSFATPTIDANDFMIPGIFLRQDADLTPVYLRKVRCGRLVDAGLIDRE